MTPLHEWKPWKVVTLGLILGAMVAALVFMSAFDIARNQSQPRTIYVHFDQPLVIQIQPAPASP